MNFNIIITGQQISEAFRIFLFCLLGILLAYGGIGIISQTWLFLGIVLVVMFIDADARVQGSND